MSLADVSKRLGTTSDLFARGEPTLPEVWRSLSSANRFRVRRDGEHVYVERIPSAQEVRFVHLAADLRQQGSVWIGTYRGWMKCREDWPRCDQPPVTLTIRSLTATRIEGLQEGIPADFKDFDCKKCRWKKPPQKKNSEFVWLPE